jgi:hypothetical protein
MAVTGKNVVRDKGDNHEDDCGREKCMQWIPEVEQCAFVVTARKLMQLADLAAALKMFAPKPK